MSCAAEAKRPNVVVIVADDHGWGSAGFLGVEDLRTPNLDRLAREGRRFAQAYAPGSVCSPTRYGLLTGRYYWRTSVEDGSVLPADAPLQIETDRLTLASLLREQGYRTAAFGKWHLGLGAEARRADWSTPLRPGPLEIGFDHFFGLAANPWNGPHAFIQDHDVLGKLPGQPVVVTGRRRRATTSGLRETWREDRIMETLTEKVTGWLEQHAREPFFLYYAPTAVHEPIAPSPRFSGSRYGRYGDFLEELDWSVGRVLETLDRLKLTDTTLVIYTSDNGGAANRANPILRAALDAGLAVNGPFRGEKRDAWEGAFRVPFLVRWPGEIPGGTVSDQLICLTDVLATLASILRVPLPPGSAEDSFDVSRALFEEAGEPIRDHVVLQAANGTFALRAGDWKLVERGDFDGPRRQTGHTGKDELFHLPVDPAETRDVLAENRELAARMKQILSEARGGSHTRSGAGV
jgi:arylsulfatase A-like enzyme